MNRAYNKYLDAVTDYGIVSPQAEKAWDEYIKACKAG